MGAVAGVLGMASAASGMLFMDIVLEFSGMTLGAFAYALGARRLGVAALVVSTVLMLIFLAANMGEIPGLDPTDPIAVASAPLAGADV